MHSFPWKQYNCDSSPKLLYVCAAFLVSFGFACLVLLRTTFFHLKWMCFYCLQPFCGSSKIVQSALLGSFLSSLNEPGFGFASLFYLRTILFIITVRRSSLTLSFHEEFLCSGWHFHLPIKHPAEAVVLSRDCEGCDDQGWLVQCHDWDKLGLPCNLSCSLSILPKHIQRDLFRVEMFLFLSSTIICRVWWWGLSEPGKIQRGEEAAWKEDCELHCLELLREMQSPHTYI